MVETAGPHKSSCKFNVPIGGSFTVTRENIISRATRTKTAFIVEDTVAAYHKDEVKRKGNSKSVPTLSAIKTPLRDGDTERPDDATYTGAYFVIATAASAADIVDAGRNPILTRSAVHSGVYTRASITFYALNSSGNRGITCVPNNLLKIRDGTPLGGTASGASGPSTTVSVKSACLSWFLA